MELIFSTFVSLLLIFFSLSFLWRRINKNHIKLPPGPWRLPVIGSLHHLTGGPLQSTLARLAQRYGPFMYLKFGAIPLVIISSPSIAKQVLRTHFPTFSNRPQATYSNILFYNNKDIVFGHYGNYWRQMRKICVAELFNSKKIKSFSGIRKDELSNFISSIRSTDGTSAVNMTEKAFQFAISVTFRSTFGLPCKDRDEFIAIIKEMHLLIGRIDVTDLLPSWKLLHKICSAKSNFVNAHQRFDAVIEGILRERIEIQAAANNEFNEDEHLVDVLLRTKENTTGLQSPITNDHVKSVLLNIITGGTETVSLIITRALTELLKNPNIMVKAQSEVRQVFQGMKSYDENDLENLTYLKLVIKETLRLHPPSPLLSRECTELIHIDEYTISHKTTVVVNLWALGRDPRSWSDPDCFIPERFENSSIDFMGDQFEFIPFGAGRRICPGLQLGLANVEIPLAYLLYHFDWKLPIGQDSDMIETTKKKDLYLIPTKYHL